MRPLSGCWRILPLMKIDLPHHEVVHIFNRINLGALLLWETGREAL